MESYLQTHGLLKTVVDGNIIDNIKWNAIYDGDVVDLEAKRNNESIYIQLDNQELMKLFEIPASKQTIHQRLKFDLQHPVHIKPIIIEETHHKTPHHKTPHHKTHHHKSKSTRNKSKSPRNKSKSKYPKNKSKSKSFRNKTRKITPDFLKTIY